MKHCFDMPTLSVVRRCSKYMLFVKSVGKTVFLPGGMLSCTLAEACWASVFDDCEMTVGDL